jgi:serine/threonine-protein kinase
MSNAVHAQLIGRTLADKYFIESLIGCGGMGAVYRARQVALDKWVAVKVLHREMEGEPKFVARFEREALSSSRLDHPNSLRVLDFGEDGGLFYLVMEYVEAEDLLGVMNREWPLSDERVVHILSQALAALAVAHDMGIVHRDLKPENILVLAGADDDGLPVDVVKVCDFGIAKVAAPRDSGSFEPSLTVDGLAIGTPDYMSPEQARGEPVDGRSDLYSIGVVLYHLLAGRTPFTGDSPLGVALQHVADEPRPPSRFRDVHPALEAICLCALAKSPADRFQTAREMRRALRAAVEAGASRSSCSMPPLVISRAPSASRRASSAPTEPTATRAPGARSLMRSRLVQGTLATGVGALVAFALSTAISPIRRGIQDRLGSRYEAAQTVATGLVQNARAVDPTPVADPRDLELWPPPPQHPIDVVGADAGTPALSPAPADSTPAAPRPRAPSKSNLTLGAR